MSRASASSGGGGGDGNSAASSSGGSPVDNNRRRSNSLTGGGLRRRSSGKMSSDDGSSGGGGGAAGAGGTLRKLASRLSKGYAKTDLDVAKATLPKGKAAEAYKEEMRQKYEQQQTENKALLERLQAERRAKLEAEERARAEAEAAAEAERKAEEEEARKAAEAAAEQKAELARQRAEAKRRKAEAQRVAREKQEEEKRRLAIKRPEALSDHAKHRLASEYEVGMDKLIEWMLSAPGSEEIVSPLMLQIFRHCYLDMVERDMPASAQSFYNRFASQFLTGASADVKRELRALGKVQLFEDVVGSDELRAQRFAQGRERDAWVTKVKCDKTYAQMLRFHLKSTENHVVTKVLHDYIDVV